MELLMMMQREAELAAKNPARNDSPVGFEQMRRLADLARDLAHENFIERMEAVLRADEAKDGPARDAAMSKLRESHAAYEFTGQAAAAIEHAHASFLGATTELMGQNIAGAQEHASASSLHACAASQHIRRFADYVERSQLELAGFWRDGVDLSEAAAKIGYKAGTMAATANLKGVEVVRGLRAASQVAADLGARVAAMPQRIVDAAKSATTSLTRAAVPIIASFMSRTVKMGRFVANASEQAYDHVSRGGETLQDAVVMGAASAAVKAIDVAGRIAGSASTALKELDAAGSRLKTRMEGFLANRERASERRQTPGGG